MESEILKFICTNQGAVNTDYLVFNLGCGDSTDVSEIISNREKFVSCCPFGQPKVVARTNLKLCRAKDCQGSCRGLHLCKNFLFSGSCRFSQSRRGCSFSHELSSDHNERILKEHELESLSRTELCTLLLQSDDRLLPPICYDYNNGGGEFGRCQDGYGCKRLHICERFLNRDCRCSRSHDFNAPQQLRVLQGVPEDLFRSLKSIYANKQALKYHDNHGNRGNKGNRQLRGGNQWNRGNREYRENRGSRQQQERTCSTSGFFAATGLYGDYGPNEGGSEQWPFNFFTSDISAATNDTDASSDNGRNRKHARNPNKTSRAGRGRVFNRGSRGNRGEHQQLQHTRSMSDIRAAFNVLDLMDYDALNEGSSEQEPLNFFTSDISAAANDTDASSDDGQNRKHARNPNKSSTVVRGRGFNHGSGGNGGKHQQLQRTRSISDISASVNVLELMDFDGPNEGNSDEQQQKSCSSDIPAAANTTDAGSADGQNRKQTGSPDTGPNKQERQRPVRDKTEICMYFIKGQCIHEERCFKAHDKMPYRWEVREGDQWTAMPDNETIEKDYCDPKNTYSSSSPPVHFDTMTCGLNKARRLSTINSLLQPTFILTTEWVWYWEDEFGKWNMYASADDGHKAADMDSSKLEQKFLDDAKDVVEFKASSQSYSLSFEDMIQTNKQYCTKRVVRRRPRFVSAADVQARRARKPLAQAKFAAIPDYWDKTQIPQTGYKRVLLQHSSKEFREIKALFCETMRGFDIVKIERIQNRYLWEAFHLQKTHMKNNNGGRDVTEKKLFHGTDNKYVDVICHTNFDWRLCGTHGTAYGKGSYFARDAKYSHSYTDDSDVKSMFIARLLVGEYTRGSPDYRRPPSKDAGDINFFDSCVDSVLKPSVYVVFEKHQIYPEYLLQYQEPNVGLFGGASVPVPRPAPQQSASFYKPSTSSYQPSAPSYQPSASPYQASTSSYQPSTSVSKPSAGQHPPTQWKKQANSPCVIA